MNNILIFGLIGHVLGDFYFQSEHLSRKKEASMRAILIHCLLYCVPFLLLSAFLVKSQELYILILLWGLFHIVIDLTKYLLSVYGRGWIRRIFYRISLVFAVDQLLHICSVTLLSLYFSEKLDVSCISIISKLVEQTSLHSHALAKGVLIVLLVLRPVNIAFSKFFYNFKPPVQQPSKGMTPLFNPKLSYLNAGEMIGCLERLIIVMFLSMNQYSAIGFVLTAKSVARYDDIAHNKQFAEYFLIGTLYSLAASMVVYWTISIL